MVWDSDEEEEEEEEEDVKERRAWMERQRWDRTEGELQSQLDQSWNNFLCTPEDGGVSSSTTPNNSNNSNGNDNDKNNKQVTFDADTTGGQHANNDTRINGGDGATNTMKRLEWSNYFMPPHPPPNLYSAPLPFDRIGQAIATTKLPASTSTIEPKSALLHSYHCGLYPDKSTNSSSSTASLDNEWRLSILSEKLRQWMETCDTIRGFQITVDRDMALFGGLAESVLQELGEECRSAGRFSVLVGGGDSFLNGGDGAAAAAEEEGGKLSYWRTEGKVTESIRTNLNNGLALHGLTENSDLVLPLSIAKCWDALHRSGGGSGRNSGSMFEASAAGALALETATLPYRLSGSGSSSSTNYRSKIGIQSGYYQGSSGQSDGNESYGTADKLSYHEFLSSLRPSNRHVMLELSALLSNGGNASASTELHGKLLQGTSVERRQLEQERAQNRNSYYRRGRARDIDPGLWLEDNGPCGGSLAPLSPMAKIGQSNRTMHRHYVLAASLRPMAGATTRSQTTTTTPYSKNPVSSYTTMLMEGMGVRYRPETSVGTVVQQGIADLIGSRSYGAGSYWKTILRGSSNSGVGSTKDDSDNVPILAVLGNTTRVHSHLNETGASLKDALSRKYTGYMTRDIMAGIVPEREDCTDALEHCMDLRDIYEPPMGGGVDEEGVYFDDNED